MNTFIERVMSVPELKDLLKYGLETYYLPMLLLVGIAVLVLITVIIRRMQIIKIRNEFQEEYQISVPKIIKVQIRKDEKSDNRIKLNFPKWEYAKKDGTADRRIGSNDVVWKNSYIYVGKYALVTDDVFLIPDMVRCLRNRGVELPPHPVEMENYNRIVKKREQRDKNITVPELVNLFSTAPHKFENFCAELLQEKGYKTFLTPPTNDGGYDIKAYKDGVSYVVECKCYAPDHSIGRPLLT